MAEDQPDEAGQPEPPREPLDPAAVAELAELLPPAGALQGRPGQDDARRLAREAQLVTMKLSGMTYEQIAERTGYSTGAAARRVVVKALSTVRDQAVADLRMVENARLERANVALWPKVIQGDVDAVHAWVKVSQARRQLNGLDAPQQVHISTGATSELEDALAELRLLVGPDLDIIAGTVLRPDQDDDDLEEPGDSRNV